MKQNGTVNVGIVGGGAGCKTIMDMIFAEKLHALSMSLIGVADINPNAIGYREARERGIFTTRDYRDLLRNENLDLIIELTGREALANEIYQTKPEHVRLMGNVAARLFWDIFRIEEERIAERKRVESTLRQDRSFLQNVFDAIRDGLTVIDSEWNIVRMNNWAEKMFDSQSPMIGKKCYEAYRIGSKPCRWCPALENATDDPECTHVIRTQAGKNTMRWIELSAFPMKNDAGNVIGIIEQVKDVTTRKKAEDDLQESELQKKAILDGSIDMIRYIDEHMRILWANKKTSETLGIPSDRINGQTCYQLFLHQDKPCRGCPTKKALETGNVEHAVMKKPVSMDPKQKKYWDCYGVPVKNQSGRVTRVIQIARDVTSQKTAEKELERRHQELEAIHAVLLRVTQEYDLAGMCRVLGDMLGDFYPGSKMLIFLLTPESNGFFLPRSNRSECKESCYDKAIKILKGRNLEHSLLEYLKQDRLKPLGSHNDKNEVPEVIQALTLGFTDWMTVPINVEERCHGLLALGTATTEEEIEEDLDFLDTLIRQVSGVIKHQILKEIREEAFRKQLAGPDSFMGFVGRSPPMQRTYRMIESVADSSSTVLITGESGTGKELIARAIHQVGRYKKSPFVIAHCSSFVPTLVHSEIFGHEKGAFTGAVSRKKGRLERAQGGILFLDEVADLPLETQVLLLRFLQDRSFERVGGERLLEVNVRVLAATNKDVEKEMKAGRLREDFYYRLNVLPIRTVPLRERLSDLPLLAEHFLKTYCLIEGKNIRGFDTDAMRLMMDYDWPGNVRELQNVVARCVVLAAVDRIGVEVIPDRIRNKSRLEEYALSTNEKNLILRVMRECNWNKHQAARLLDINRGTLYSKLKRYNIRPES